MANVEHVVQAIESLASTGRVNAVQFGGGEPILARKSLLRLLQFVKSKNIDTQIVTNGSFAVSEEKAFEIVGELHFAGLDNLHVSYDDFQAPFVPFERIAHLWRAAKKIPFSSVVLLTADGPKCVIDKSWLRQQLDEDIPDFDMTACATRRRGVTHYGITTVALQRIGRGTTEVAPNAARHYEDGRDVIKLRCPSIFSQPAISANNHLIACGGRELDGNPFLDFGPLINRSATQVFEAGHRRPVALAIALYGPGFLAKWLEKYAGIPCRDDYAGICEICQDVTTKPEYQQALFKHARDLWPYIDQRLRENAEAQKTAIAPTDL